MKFIGLGANISSINYGSPKETLCAALQTFCDWKINVIRTSSWYESAPVPLSDQAWYINAVSEVETSLSPHQLISSLLSIEALFGRERQKKNGPRTIDLDLLAYDEIIIDGEVVNDIEATVPHPRMDKRSFVLKPLHELSPNWVHPKYGLTIKTLLKNLPSDQQISAL